MKKQLILLSIILNIFEINSQELNLNYTVIIDDFPKSKYVEEKIVSKQFSFDFHDWISNRDTNKVKLYSTYYNYRSNNSTSLNELSKKMITIDSIRSSDLSTGQDVITVVATHSDLLYFTSITFHEKWSISDFIKIESNYFTLNRFENDSFKSIRSANFDKELRKIYIKNNAEIDNSKIDNSFTIEYIINLDSVNQSFFKSYLFCDSFIKRNIEKGNFKMCFNDNSKMYISDINEYLLKINNYKDSSLFIGIRLREKWQWDEYGVFNKKILGYAPIIKIIRENQYIGQMPLFWIYPIKK